MEEMRAYLHDNENRSSPTIANLLTFFSQASMGAGPIGAVNDARDGNGAVGGVPSSSNSTAPDGDGAGPSGRASPPSSPVAAMRGLLARGAAKAYRDFVWQMGAAVRHRLSDGSGRATDEEALWPQVDAQKYEQLETLLGGALLSLRSLRKAAYKYPPLLDMDPAELAMRLVSLKQSLAGCDVAHLVEQEPQLYLGGRREDIERRVNAAMELLNAELAGADVAAVVMRDPRLPFMPELPRGLQELRELWDVDEAALAASDPQMLALAVRALSVSGLPKGL